MHLFTDFAVDKVRIGFTHSQPNWSTHILLRVSERHLLTLEKFYLSPFPSRYEIED